MRWKAFLALFCLSTALRPATWVIDNFSSGTLTNSLGGTWGSYHDASSTVSLNPAKTPAYSGPYCLEEQVNVASGGYGGSYTSLNPSFNATDISAYTGVQFWIQGTPGSNWQVSIATNATAAANNHYAYNFTLTGTWTQVTVPFSSLQQYWGTPSAWDPQHATTVDFLPSSAPNASWMQLGEVEFYTASGPTPTPSNTGTPGPGPNFYSYRPKADQVGYLPSDSKSFSVMTQTAGAGAPFAVVDSGGNTVFSGNLGGTVFDDTASSFEWVVRGDFSALHVPGTYHVVAGGQSSQPFVIGDTAYDALWKDALRCFSLIRCGTAVNDAATGISYASCHPTNQTDTVPALNRDFTGGWHNAGDFGKWAHEEAFSASQMLWLCELRPDLAGYTPGGDPGLLTEARWGLTWLFKMQNPDGSVIHKVDSEPNFAAGYMPDTDPTVSKARYASTYSTIDAADLSAVMAQAARVYAASDPSFAAQCASASAQSWAWTQAHPNQGQSDPYYTDSTVWQEYLWAEAEQFRLTRDPGLQADLATRLPAQALTVPSWADPQLLGHFTLAFDNGAGSDASLRATAQNRMTSLANTLKAKSDASGYGSVQNASEYYWGSIALVTGAGNLFCAVNAFSGQDVYRQAALRMMDNILGVNALDHSHAALYGTRSNQKPYHWAYLAHQKVMPGWLSEGPNRYTSGADPNLTNLINQGTAPAKCFLDDGTSWASNEGTTDIQSSFVLLSGYFHSALGPPPTATPSGQKSGAADGSLKILAQALVPNPWVPGASAPRLRVQLSAATTGLEVQAYSPAWTLLGKVSLPGGGPGWINVQLPEALFPNGGIQYLRVRAMDGSRQSQAVVLRSYVLR
jgi:endoglucanase